jgi:hypothetical protein
VRGRRRAFGWLREAIETAEPISAAASRVCLQIMGGKEKPPFPVLFKNLPIILKVMITGSLRIRTLMTRVLENPQFDHEGYFVGRAQMILGLLYWAKKKRALALQHLTEAKRILSQFGQTLYSRESKRRSRNWDSIGSLP